MPERTVTFLTQGGSAVEPVSVSIGALLPEPPVPRKTGFMLSGWYRDAACTDKWDFANDRIPDADLTLYAGWTPCQYTVSFDSRGGSALSPAVVNYGALVNAPGEPVREGHRFLGWYKEPSCINPWNFSSDTMPSGNVTLYAGWTPCQYNVSFDSRGGSALSPAAVSYGAYVKAPGEPAREGHRFLGWYKEPYCATPWNFNLDTMPANNITLYAGWTLCRYTVSFDSRGGSAVASAGADYGSAVVEPAAPALAGYNFAGWYREPYCVSKWNFASDTVTADVTLYAKWEQQPQTNLLAGVSLSSGYLNRAFSPAVASYKITMGEHEGSFTLTPIKQFDGASMTINKRAQSSYTVNLASGKSAKISVKVTLGKKSKTYTFTVTRPKSSNNYLSSLTSTAGAWSQGFDPNVLNYTLTLDENTKSVAIRAAAAAGKAARVSPASKKISLNNGQSKTLKITVRAQSGARRTYTVTVVRAPSTNANLKSLKASGLSPGFSPGVTQYTVVLPANKSSASISARTVGYKAAVYIDGAKKSSKKVALANGQSAVVRVTVAAQAGNSKDYLITVIRQ